jgi:hypothetical protein
VLWMMIMYCWMRKKCFILKKQLDEENNVLRNTHVHKFSLKRDSQLHPKLLNVNQSFKYMQNPTHR